LNAIISSYLGRGLQLAALFFFISSAVAGEWVVSAAGEFYPKRPPQMALAADGTPVVAYYDQAGNIQVRRQGVAPQPLNDQQHRGRLSGLELAAVGEVLVAVWRQRLKEGHALVSRRSTDGGTQWGDPVIVDSATQPLPRMQLGSDAKQLYLLWLGRRPDAEPDPVVADSGEQEAEKEDRSERSYHIYAAHSVDQGRSWSAAVQLTTGYTDSIWPALAENDGTAYSFTSSVKEDSRHLLVRRRGYGGEWSAPWSIKEVGDVILLRGVPLQDGIMVLWLASYPGYYLLEGAISRDGGVSWHSFASAETKELDIANLETAVQNQRINIVFSARPRARGGPRKQTVYLLHSANSGRDWQPLQELRHHPKGRTHALYPRIVADDERVVAVWNDFRNFRGGLYFNFSKDGGETWLQEDVPLGPRGGHNTSLYPFARNMALHQGNGYILAGRFRRDQFSQAVDLVLTRFEPKAVYPERSLMDDPGSEEKVALLRERAVAFWEALQKGDYEATYGLFDPFFRGRFRQVDYLSATGMVKYHGYEIEDVVVEGNLGQVTLSYKYEIPDFTTRLGTVSRPLTEARTRETWLFIDGNWYKEYRSESSQSGFGRY